MKQLFLSSCFLFSSFLSTSIPAHAGIFVAADVNKYKAARALEKSEPSKACEAYQALAKKKDFVLQDLAFIKQGLFCDSPTETAPFEISERPWLMQPDLDRKLVLAKRKQDWLGVIEVRNELARMEKSQKVALAQLKESEEILEKSTTDAAIRTQALGSIENTRQSLAPRFIKEPNESQELAVAQDLLLARQFDEARKMARKIQKRKKLSFEDELATHKIIRSSLKLENNTAEFLKSLANDWKWILKLKRPAKALEIGTLYTRALWTDGKTAAAKKILTEVEKKLAGEVKLNDIYLIRGKMAEEHKDWLAARLYYEKATLDLKSQSDKKIQFAKAWVSWKSKDYPKALEALDPLVALATDDPSESSRALYWKARVLRNSGQEEAARTFFKQLQTQDPLGFYGTLTYRELGEKMAPLKEPKVPKSTPEFQKSPHFNADYFKALFETGELEILQAAANHALQKVHAGESIEDSLPVFLAAAKAKSYLPLFSQITTLKPEDRLLLLGKEPELLFPMDYKDIIISSGAKFGVAPELIFSIIRQESAFNPYARSHADALGLMQLLPSIAKSFQVSVKLEVAHFEDLYLPEINIPYGTALLQDLLRRHDQKVFRTAAAYNASERALKNWIKARWNNDPVEFIEEIPYEETRTYVKLILRNFTFYSRLLNSNPIDYPKGLLAN